MNLKIKYCEAKKKELKTEYIKEKRRLLECHREQGKERKFRKILSRISKQAKSRSDKGMKQIRKKVEWSESKLKCQEVKSGFRSWAERVSRGRGKGRQRHRVKIRCYGGVKADKNEKDCLSLPPKTMTYPEVKISNVDLSQDIGDHKTRWTRKKERL